MRRITGHADQHEMAADVQLRILLCQTDRVVEGRGFRHERRRGQNAVSMRLDNTGVRVAREAEIIRVDNQ